jgi:phosphoserine aminotransferase
MARRYNFSAGPSVLPERVVRETQAALWELEGCGMGVAETSHRGKPFLAVIERAEARLRRLMGLADDQRVLFLHGGARTQFFQVPANLLRGGRAAYVDTGLWSAAAIDEARRYGTVDVPWSSRESGYRSVPSSAAWTPPAAGTRYLHVTTNNTVYGTQWSFVPDAGGAWLVGDASSDVLSDAVPYHRFDLLYAGAQKNLGIAGVTVVVVRQALLDACDPDLPSMLRYPLQAAKQSLYNTPCTTAIYVLERVLAWIEDEGGPAEVGRRNAARAAKVYEAIDGSGGFYQGRAEPGSRSRMNVVFTTGDAARDARFVAAASAEGLLGLKGHSSAGGLRASLYNAQPDAAVDALVAFLGRFRDDEREVGR